MRDAIPAILSDWPWFNRSSLHDRSVGGGLATAALGTAGWFGSPDGALALFQMLLPAEAAVLGIVVSVSFLSLQISATQYAPLVSTLYRNDIFTGLIERFGLAIFADIVFIVTAPWFVMSPLARSLTITVAGGLAVWSFLFVFRIKSRLEAFLNPDPVLDDLLEDISYDRYRRFTRTRQEAGRSTRDPLLEIYQIATTALEKHDNYGAIRSIDTLGEATQRLLSDYSDGNDPNDEIGAIHKVFTYWDGLARAATERGTDDVLHTIVETEYQIARTLIEEEREELAVQAVRSIVYFHVLTVEMGVTHHTEKLGNLLEMSLESDQSVVTREVVRGIVVVTKELAISTRPVRGECHEDALTLFQYLLAGWETYSDNTARDDGLLMAFEAAIVEIVATWE